MKKVLILAMIGVLIISTMNIFERDVKGEEVERKILFDERRLPQGSGCIGFWYSINNNEWCGYSNSVIKLENLGFIVRNKKSGTFSLKELLEYDILVLTRPPEDGYDESELSAIRKFIEMGGSLLQLGNAYYPNKLNSVSEKFGVHYSQIRTKVCDSKNYYEGSHCYSPKISDIRYHEITKNVKEVYFNWTTYFEEKSKGTDILLTSKDSWADLEPYNKEKEGFEKPGPLIVLIALEYYKGKAIFSGDETFLSNSWSERGNNSTLAMNMFNWLSNTQSSPKQEFEKQVDEANRIFDEAKNLFEEKKYDSSRWNFKKAKDMFIELVQEDKAKECDEYISEIDNMKMKEAREIEGDVLFQEGQDYFQKGEFEKAKYKFGKAADIYLDIDNIEKYDETLEMLLKCNTEINKAIIRSEADSLFDQGKQVFENKDYESAKSSFEEAKQKYVEIGDTEKVTECEEWLQKIEEQKKEEKKKAGIEIWAVLIGFVLTIGFLRRR